MSTSRSTTSAARRATRGDDRVGRSCYRRARRTRTTRWSPAGELRRADRRARTPACSRSTARTSSTTRSRQPRPASAPRVVAYLPELGALVLDFIEGEMMGADDLRRGDRLREVADAMPAAARRPALPRRLQHVRVQERYIAIVQERGLRLPERYLEFEPQVSEIERAMRVRAEGTVPCNNDLLAENFIDAAARFRLIDYEYSGNNDADVRARQRLERVESLARASSRSSSAHYYGRPLREQGRARAPVGPDVEVRLDALGARSRTGVRPRLRLLELGHGEVRAGAWRSSTARTSRGCARTSSVRTDRWPARGR